MPNEPVYYAQWDQQAANLHDPFPWKVYRIGLKGGETMVGEASTQRVADEVIKDLFNNPPETRRSPEEKLADRQFKARTRKLGR